MANKHLLNEYQQQLLNRLLKDRVHYRLTGFRFITIEWSDSSKEYKVYVNRTLEPCLADNIVEVEVL